MATSFQKVIETELNKRCMENGSNTPDFLLAEYLMDCLNTWNKMTKKRDDWYGVHLVPGTNYFEDKETVAVLKTS